MSWRYKFRPQLIPTLVTALLIFGLISLGQWQLRRMAEKQALFTEFAAGGGAARPLTDASLEHAPRYQHISASGRYDDAHQFLLDNMTHDGSIGYRVLTPLLVSTSSGSKVLLVDRGWVAAGVNRRTLPDVHVDAKERQVSGRLDNPPAAGIYLRPRPDRLWPRVLSYPKMQDLRQALGQPVFTYILLLDANQPDGYLRQWRPATFPPERHLGYAVTWFALALTLAIIYITVNLHKQRE